jgi:hypothetical protein
LLPLTRSHTSWIWCFSLVSEIIGVEVVTVVAVVVAAAAVVAMVVAAVAVVSAVLLLLTTVVVAVAVVERRQAVLPLMQRLRRDRLQLAASPTILLFVSSTIVSRCSKRRLL